MKKVLLLTLAIGLMVSTAVFSRPGHAQSPNRYSVYVPMRDGVRLAVDVWLPSDLADGATIPTLMKSTRYWRSIQNLDDPDPDVAFFNSRGYAVVRADVRGTGASEGVQTMVWSDAEVADLGEIAQWITEQTWSNGRVGAYGVSYEGNLAEMTAVPNHPAVKAVAPQFDDFDPLLYLAMPGGVFNEWFISTWQQFNTVLDSNDLCFIAQMQNMDCEMLKSFTPGIRNVDADADRAIVDAIIAARTQNIDVYTLLKQVEFRDDTAGLDATLSSVSPFGRRAEIESSGVPMFVQVGWLDAATVDGALARYMTFSNPQQLVIGAWSHGGEHDTDPFAADNAPTTPEMAQQYSQLAEFFDLFLLNDTPAPSSSITYYTMNAGTWSTTDVWPPVGFAPQRWYLGEGNTLSVDAPTSETGADEYAVDTTATTGTTTRWHTQESGGDVIYPDRAAEDAKLLTYTSAPLAADLEITGSPVITLNVASTLDDAAFHVYLEAVAPDGRVTYITEGIFRATHRKVSADTPPYTFVGPTHSYLRADAMPLVPGEVAEVSFNLYATSVLIEAGHSLRVAIAGADAGIFARYPVEGDAIWTIQRNAVTPSFIELPVKAE